MEILHIDMTQAAFWVAVLKIIIVNLLLSGDNAVVIALACMHLPPRQRLWGMILGAGVAVLLRIAFTLVVAEAMDYPYLKLAGGVLLLWVAVKLVAEDAGQADGEVQRATSLWQAIWLITVADVVMSLDNVIAIAASAETAATTIASAHAASVKTLLIVFGLATSVPIIVTGAALLTTLLRRVPILVWAGGAVLGWVAGDIMALDGALRRWLPAGALQSFQIWSAAIGAVLVVVVGYVLMRSRRGDAERL